MTSSLGSISSPKEKYNSWVKQVTTQWEDAPYLEVESVAMNIILTCHIVSLSALPGIRSTAGSDYVQESMESLVMFLTDKLKETRDAMLSYTIKHLRLMTVYELNAKVAKGEIKANEYLKKFPYYGYISKGGPPSLFMPSQASFLHMNYDLQKEIDQTNSLLEPLLGQMSRARKLSSLYSQEEFNHGLQKHQMMAFYSFACRYVRIFLDTRVDFSKRVRVFGQIAQGALICRQYHELKLLGRIFMKLSELAPPQSERNLESFYHFFTCVSCRNSYERCSFLLIPHDWDIGIETDANTCIEKSINYIHAHPRDALTLNDLFTLSEIAWIDRDHRKSLEKTVAQSVRYTFTELCSPKKQDSYIKRFSSISFAPSDSDKTDTSLYE